MPELIALAKKRPGEISYATTGVGRLTHLAGELLQHQAGIKLLLVPYTGGPSHAFSDVASGRVAMIIEGYSGIAGAARSGAVKLIAVASAKRLAEFPNVPTVAETIPGFQATGWAVLVAPVGTPEGIIRKVSDDLRKVTAEPELEKKLAALGSYTNPMTAAEATAFIHKQQQMWQPVLDDIAKQQKRAARSGERPDDLTVAAPRLGLAAAPSARGSGRGRGRYEPFIFRTGFRTIHSREWAQIEKKSSICATILPHI